MCDKWAVEAKPQTVQPNRRQRQDERERGSEIDEKKKQRKENEQMGYEKDGWRDSEGGYRFS